MVDHFEREGITRQTVYNALNRRKNGQSILEVTRSGRPSAGSKGQKNGAVNLLIFYINRRRK